MTNRTVIHFIIKKDNAQHFEAFDILSRTNLWNIHHVIFSHDNIIIGEFINDIDGFIVGVNIEKCYRNIFINLIYSNINDINIDMKSLSL